jgi:branched-chain amino acid transport system substrate-binding protein
MHPRGWRLALLVAVAVSPLLPGCRAHRGAAPPAARPWVIGAVFPLSAGAGRIGQMKQQGADLAVKHLNAAGGVKGRPLKIVYVDSKNDVGEARSGFDKLVDVDHAHVVMSAMSQISLTLVPVADRRQVVLFANASHPDLTRKSPYVFRNLPSTEKNATTMADTAFHDLGARRVAVLYLNDDYGAEANRLFSERFTSLGGTIVGAEGFDRNAQDVKAQLGKLAAAKPDAWWMPAYGSAFGLALKQKAELKITGRVLSDLGLVDQDVLRLAGAGAEDAVVVCPLFDASSTEPAVKRFVDDFQEAYHETPSFDAAFQYDAVGLIATALGKATADTGPAIREALSQVRDYAGVCGPSGFGNGGDADMKVVVRRMMGGKLEPLKP